MFARTAPPLLDDDAAPCRGGRARESLRGPGDASGPGHANRSPDDLKNPGVLRNPIVWDASGFLRRGRGVPFWKAIRGRLDNDDRSRCHEHRSGHGGAVGDDDRGRRRHVVGAGRFGLVLEEGALVGIFTERDILSAFEQFRADPARVSPVSKGTTRNPLTIGPDATVGEAMDKMLDGGFRHLPVMDGRTLVGIVSMRDLARSISKG
jgi:CBS domain-containing protein